MHDLSSLIPIGRFFRESSKPPCRFRFIVLLVMAAVFHSVVVAQPKRTIEADTSDPYSRSVDILSAGLEFIASPGEGSFFEEYANLGGNVNSFEPRIVPSATARLVLSQAFRVVLYGTYTRNTFTDIYDVSSQPDSTGIIVASLVENFSASAVPILAGLEFAPLRSQFTSYVGVMGGVVFNSTTWKTSTRQQAAQEFFRPATNLDELGLGLGLRVYTGIDLRFDRFFSGRSAFRGIYLEASFLLLPITHGYFEDIRKQGKGFPRMPSDDRATVYAGGLTFTFGVNLQSLRF